jgi:hypothetical protein
VAKKRISVQAAKAKGRNLQKLVQSKVLGAFSSLTTDDVRSTSMGAGGSDVQLSQAAKALFPYDVECKAGKIGTIPKKLYDWIGQASEHGEGHPLVVFRADYKSAYVILSLDHFMEIIQRGYQAGEQSDRLAGEDE